MWVLSFPINFISFHLNEIYSLLFKWWWCSCCKEKKDYFSFFLRMMVMIIYNSLHEVIHIIICRRPKLLLVVVVDAIDACFKQTRKKETFSSVFSVVFEIFLSMLVTEQNKLEMKIEKNLPFWKLSLFYPMFILPVSVSVWIFCVWFFVCLQNVSALLQCLVSLLWWWFSYLEKNH